jgi:NitT/TauT family transport system substrate-binding protein
MIKRRTFISGMSVLLPSLFIPFSCTSNPAPSSQEIAAIIPLNLGFSAIFGSLPWEISRRAKLFRDRQLNVDIKWFENYADSVNALASGLLDANTQTLIDTLKMVDAGVAAKIVLASSYSMGDRQIIAQPGLERVAALNGKKVALKIGSSEHFLLELGLQREGISPQDLDIISLDSEAAIAAFLQGRVDAIAVADPWTQSARTLKGSRVLWSSADFPGAISSQLVVRKATIEQFPQAIQKAIATWFDTLDLMERKQQRCQELMAKRAEVSMRDIQQQQATIELLDSSANARAFKPGNTFDRLSYTLEKSNQFLVRNNLISAPIASNQLLDRQFLPS